MDNAASDRIRCRTRANANRRNWVTVLEDVWDYCFPMRQGFYHEAPGQERMEKIFDETPIDAIAEFASIIQEGLFSGAWFKLIPGTMVDPKAKESVQAELDVVNNYVYELLDQSNFESETYEAIMEMGASVGTLYIREGDAINPFIAQAISMIHLDFEVDANGQIDTIYRLRKVKGGDLASTYPDATIPASVLAKGKRNPKKEMEVLETCKRNREEVGTETWDYFIDLVSEKVNIQQYEIRGDGSKPMIAFRWSADSGQALGRGPLITALPAIRNLNLVKEMGLENAQLHIGGVFQADDDGTYNFDNVEIVPMSVMSRTPGTKGLEAVTLPGNPDMTQFVVQDLQNSIRMVLLNGQFGSLEKTPRSVEELMGRTGTQMRKIRAPLKRLVNELVLPSAKRIIYILKKRGLIDLPKIDGKSIGLIARGPLIRMMNALENEDLIEFTMLVKQMFGPESRLYVHDDKVIGHIAKNKELPGDILVTETEREVLAGEIVNQLQPGAQPEGAAPLPVNAPALTQ